MTTQKKQTQDRNGSPQPKSTGKYLKSEMIRVDCDFANFIRNEATKADISVTETTRMLYLLLQNI